MSNKNFQNGLTIGLASVEAFSNIIRLGINDSAENWHEIPVEKETALQNNNYQEVI
jgi:hypothetical protein